LDEIQIVFFFFFFFLISISLKCKIITSEYDISQLPKHIINLGVSPIYLNPIITEKQITLSDEDKTNEDLMEQTIMILIDGKVIGWCSAKRAKKVADTLRFWKVNGRNNIPLDIELAFIPPSHGGQYPGLFIFTIMSRMTRPLKYLANGKMDMVGSLEQVYMEIACLNEDIVPCVTTHQDFTPTDILSVIANMTPFSDLTNLQEIFINARWVSKQWVPQHIIFQVELIIRCIVYKQAKYQSLDQKCMINASWIIIQMV